MFGNSTFGTDGVVERKECVIPIHRPDRAEFVFFFICGLIMSVPITLFIDNLANPLLTGLSSSAAMFLSVAVFAPFIEEFSKVFPLYYRHGETQRSVMQLALAVGLGFGVVEVLTYVAAYGAGVLPFRLASLVFHPANASISAYGIATKRPLSFYLLAVALHFSINFASLTAPVAAWVFVLGLTVWISWTLYGKTKEKFISEA